MIRLLSAVRQPIAMEPFLVAAVLVTTLIALLVQTVESSPFQWFAVALAPCTLVGFYQPSVCRETGALLARSGVVLCLLAGQLEFGSGRRFWPKGGDWLAAAFLFAVIVLLLHITAHFYSARAAQATQLLEQQRLETERLWRDDVLAALKRQPSRRWKRGALLGTGLVVLLVGRYEARRRCRDNGGPTITARRPLLEGLSTDKWGDIREWCESHVRDRPGSGSL